MEWKLVSPMFTMIQHNCARSYGWTMALLEMGVEQEADVVCLQEPTRERAGIGINHWADDIRTRKREWSVVPKGSSLTMTQRTDLSKNAGDNVIDVDINMMGEKMIRIINIYDLRVREPGERSPRRQNWLNISRWGGAVWYTSETSTTTVNSGIEGTQNGGKPNTWKR